MKNIFSIAGLIVISLLFFSFSKGGKTPYEGYKKVGTSAWVKEVVKSKEKVVADTGGAVFLKLKFMTQKDSIFINVNEQSHYESFPVLIKQPVFKGDFMYMFMHAHAGDSTRFFIQLDTLRKYYPEDFKFQLPYDTMHYLGFSIKVDSVYTKAMVDTLRSRLQQEEMKKQMVKMKIDQVVGGLQQKAKAKEPQLKTQNAELLKPFLIQYNFNQPPDEDSIYFQTLKPGNGAALKLFDKVSVRYTGTYLDGTIFDANTMVDGQEPLVFTLGVDPMITGFTKCVYKMHVGEKAMFVLPPNMAYKDGLTRVFEVEVLSVQSNH